MDIKITNFDEDCNVQRSIKGIAINAPSPKFPIGSSFEVVTKINQPLLTNGGIFCLSFLNNKAEEAFPNGLEVSVIAIPSAQPSEYKYKIEVISNSCPCSI